MKKARTFAKWALLASGAGLTLGVILYYWLVIVSPGDHIKRNNILAVVSRESPVYYEDGHTRMGTFFSEEHRRYVHFEEMPQCLIDAIMASEDADFFSHPGFNPISIARAMLANLKASIESLDLRIVQGGSTLTQQTAKNLFKRKDRSLKEKLRELINALRLEAHYSKEEILEFYLNQFYVNANGRGVGIAAEYFFNKDVSELDLVECAFIAGSVKGPDQYNPAIQRTPENAAAALERANTRKNYVLRRMHDEQFIDVATYEQAREEPVDFDIGRFRYPRSVVLDEVERELQSPRMQALLAEHEVSDLNTSGIQVVTTLEREIQSAAEAAVRRNLSSLKIRLDGYQVPGGWMEEDDPRGLRAHREHELEPGRFYRGEVASIRAEQPALELRFGGISGIVDQKGLMACAEPLIEGKKGTWTRVREKHAREFATDREIGELLYVYVREGASEEHPALLDCLREFGPDEKLQGGLVVLERGRIRALVGSYYNTNFNRAFYGYRQPGSAFKPIVYLAALSLGWNIADPVPNDRELFEFQTTYYFPRPDHQGSPGEISLSWAGAKSENVASVWLLYHLLDKLNVKQVANVAAAVGLAPKADESNADYTRRIRDDEGILLTDDKLNETAFLEARETLATDLIFEGELAQARLLRELHYGSGFSPEVKQFEAERRAARSKSYKKELELRLDVLAHSYLDVLRCRDIAQTGSREWKERCATERYRQVWQGISKSTLEELQTRMDERRQSLGREYVLENLARMRDFRVLLALRYTRKLAGYLGVESELEEVLSFPLGTNVLPIIELAKAYQTAGTGRWFGTEPEHPTGRPALIQEIRLSNGESIYQRQLNEEVAVGEDLSNSWREILRAVVRYGTGRRIDRNLVLKSTDPARATSIERRAIRVPAFGKTGTAQRYMNATFAGLLPYFASGEDTIEDEALDGARSFAIVSYVGYDDNQPMRTPAGQAIAGATGALPAWLETAQAIIAAHGYDLYVDPFDLHYIRTKRLKRKLPIGALAVAVDGESGLPRIPLRTGEVADFETGGVPYLLTPGRVGELRFEPARMVRPFDFSRAQGR